MSRHLVPRAAPLGEALLDPEPRPLTAMIDVSDGLARDLRTLCGESGVGAAIDGEALPVPRAIGDIFGLEGNALADFALASGEEYVLLAAVRPEALGTLPPGAAVIGRVVSGNEGLVINGAGGARPLPELGYEHAF